MTPPQLAERILETDGAFEREVLDERLQPQPQLEHEQRKTHRTLVVAIIAGGALLAYALGALVLSLYLPR